MSNQSQSSTVLVSGASGFIALHIINDLLKKGYNVIGTVRSQGKADEITKKFSDRFGNDIKLKLVIVKDISEEGAFDSVFQQNKDIKYVLHTASPFSFGGSDDLKKTFVDPAVNGTLGILSSVEKYGSNVEKVVVTSSFAAVANVDKFGDPSFVHTEETWNPVEWEHVNDSEEVAYFVSKKLAERAAWDFVKDHDVKFSLNTVTPPYVFGPQCFDEDAKQSKLNTSAQLINDLVHSTANDTQLLKGAVFPSVDVRDVSAVHLLALERDIKGKRLLTIGKGIFSNALILEVLNNEFSDVLKGSILDPPAEQLEQDKKAAAAWDNSSTVELLGGYSFIPFETQVVDTAKQILSVDPLN